VLLLGLPIYLLLGLVGVPITYLQACLIGLLLSFLLGLLQDQ
jgi:hypothetical protein